MADDTRDEQCEPNIGHWSIPEQTRDDRPIGEREIRPGDVVYQNADGRISTVPKLGFPIGFVGERLSSSEEGVFTVDVAGPLTLRERIEIAQWVASCTEGPPAADAIDFLCDAAGIPRKDDAE